jgi:acyl carrier protein
LVFQEVAGILAEIIDVDAEDITPETELTNEYGIKAIDVAKLVIACEKKFKIKIYDEDVHTLKCVNDVVEYIKQMQGKW